ncbi:MAG: DUF4097 family beta strand repeat-containing protein [Planctomycetaceae bacterium]|nr:DUF4097 family beta strand repeat-containing protein [Planctomycetaceae bacterium]
MAFTNLIASLLIASCVPLSATACESTQEVPKNEQHIQRFDRHATLAPAEGKDHTAPERIVAETPNGSLRLEVDSALREVEVLASFKVDGLDVADAERRAATTKLFAERHSDGTVVVQVVFPGQRMARDLADVTVRVPTGGDSTLKTTNGAVVTRGTAGVLKIVSRNGSVDVERHAGDIDARTDNGTIELDAIGGGVQARTANGAITVSLADGNDAAIDIESRNGSVSLSLGHDYDGRILARTVAGAVSLADPAKRAVIPEQGRTSITVELGSGLGESHVRTSNGQISIEARAR